MASAPLEVVDLRRAPAGVWWVVVGSLATCATSLAQKPGDGISRWLCGGGGTIALCNSSDSEARRWWMVVVVVIRAREMEIALHQPPRPAHHQPTLTQVLAESRVRNRQRRTVPHIAHRAAAPPALRARRPPTTSSALAC